jgi:hypothetical protein
MQRSKIRGERAIDEDTGQMAVDPSVHRRYFALDTGCRATFSIFGEEGGVVSHLSRMTLRTIEVICLFVKLQPRMGKFGTRKLWVVMCKS